MARGRDRHDAKRTALAALGKDLSRRAGSACELCGGKQSPRPHLVLPTDAPDLESTALLCERCRGLVDGGRLPDPVDVRFLETAIWAEVPPVQIAAIRLLRRVAEEAEVDWAAEALDGLWLPDDIQEQLGE